MKLSSWLVRCGVVMAGAVFFAGCQGADEADEADEDHDSEQEPGQTAAGSEELISSVSCKERNDVAYIKGQASAIKVITIGGKPTAKATGHAFLKMQRAAHEAGVSLSINSGFRTQGEQQYFYNCYKTGKCNNGNLAAKPGYSNHQSGLALDLTTSSWLAKNAGKYGFIRTVPSEAWHYEYTGGTKDPGGPCTGQTQAATTLTWQSPSQDATIGRQNAVLQVKVTSDKVQTVKFFQGSLLFASASRGENFSVAYDFKFAGDKTISALGYDANGAEVAGAENNVDVTVTE